MESALISLVGVLIGVLLAEHFRRRNRVESYSQKVFERRLEIYEGLMALVQAGYAAASEAIENTHLSPDERSGIVFPAGLDIAEYTDQHALFIDQYVAAEAAAFLIGVSDISAIENPTDREAEISMFRRKYRDLKRMIIQESGVHQVNQHFKSISKSNPQSPLIRRLKELQKHDA